ncbi:MAG: tetratricopeptide repeat protein [Chloroflexi bacterium]|nr:tetratricopeptide repeat protein [Chloroflexota bacterium]
MPTKADNARKLIEAAKFSEAAALAEELLDSQIEDEQRTETLYLLAVAQRFGNRIREALATLQRLHGENPGYARAWQERGHICSAEGWHKEAIAAYSRAVDRNPALTASWRSLAELHERNGDRENARRARERLEFLKRLPPELVQVTDLIHERKFQKADQLCRKFLESNRRHVEGMRLLAEIGTHLKIYDDAEFLLESCVEFAPDYIPARIDYANLLIRKTNFEKANEQAQWLVDLQPDNPSFKTTLATTLVGLGRFDEGIALYRELLDADPTRSQLHLLTGHAQKTLGAFDDAIESYRQAHRHRPDFGDAFWSLANTKTYRFSDEEIRHIRRYEQAPNIAADDRIHLCFAAGKALEDRADYAASFEYYERGNTLKIKENRYRAEVNEERARTQMETCAKKLFERRAGVGFESGDPIFIVGLPRAGSTLLEQILASHSLVDGTMELHNILALAQRLRGRQAERNSRYPQILHELDHGYFRRFGEQYIEQTRTYRGGAPFFIDKMPNNFMHVGLIRLILPNAKVIDARRHPMACCFSCFKQLFGEGQDFSYGLEEVGRYYRTYVRLMDHWDEVLPGFVLRVMHEEVVDDLESQVRRILDFCGLPFEQNCVQFHTTERNIRTPSSEQVRQPIFRDGLDRWRCYEKHLGPLEEALGAEILDRYPAG